MSASLPKPAAEVTAARVNQPLNHEAMPADADWERATPVRFSADWQGNGPDPQRETEVRLLWSPEFLYLKFSCRYRTLTVFDDAEPSGRRDELWERDVAEAFLQPDRFGSRHYKEFEISPNGQWIDLDITPDGGKPLSQAMRRIVSVDPAKHLWIAVLAIPMKILTAHFDAGSDWRVNFFRCEGVEPQRAYLAWLPNNSPKPNFHVPESFGTLRFAQ